MLFGAFSLLKLLNNNQKVENLGLIGSAILTFLGNKESDKQAHSTCPSFFNYELVLFVYIVKQKQTKVRELEKKFWIFKIFKNRILL